jgi:hypothetical protein
VWGVGIGMSLVWRVGIGTSLVWGVGIGTSLVWGVGISLVWEERAWCGIIMWDWELVDAGRGVVSKR